MMYDKKNQKQIYKHQKERKRMLTPSFLNDIIIKRCHKLSAIWKKGAVYYVKNTI